MLCTPPEPSDEPQVGLSVISAASGLFALHHNLRFSITEELFLISRDGQTQDYKNCNLTIAHVLNKMLAKTIRL